MIEEKRLNKKEYDKIYYEENKEKIAEGKKKYREENKEKILAYKKKYREENKEKVSACQKKYYEENKESHKKYYEENKEKVAARGKKYREENKGKVAAYHKKYREENKEKIAEGKKKYRKDNRNMYRARNQKRRALKKSTSDGSMTPEVFEYLTKKVKTCIICGVSLTDDNRHFDHIKPLSRRGIHSKYNIWPICAPCNLSKKDKDPYKWNKYRYVMAQYDPRFLDYMDSARLRYMVNDVEMAEKFYSKAVEIAQDWIKYGFYGMTFGGDKEDIPKFFKEAREIKAKELENPAAIN